MYLPTAIVDPVTGERVVFDEDASSEERLVWHESKPANVEPPPAHYHPETEERFVVREGHLVVRVDGDEHRLGADEELVVPARTPHCSYTGGDAARVRREVMPPGRWREFLTTRFACSHAVGELSGVRGLLQSVLLLRAYPDIVVPERPPRTVQRVLFPVLAVVARALGLGLHHSYPRDDGDASAT